MARKQDGRSFLRFFQPLCGPFGGPKEESIWLLDSQNLLVVHLMVQKKKALGTQESQNLARKKEDGRRIYKTSPYQASLWSIWWSKLVVQDAVDPPSGASAGGPNWWSIWRSKRVVQTVVIWWSVWWSVWWSFWWSLWWSTWWSLWWSIMKNFPICIEQNLFWQA